VDKQKKLHHWLGLVIFTVGLVLGVAFNALAVWGDLEAMSFWSSREAAMFNRQQEINARLGPLRCPLLINSQETGTIQTTISNLSDEAYEVTYITDISNLNVEDDKRRDMQEITLAPGEKRTISWTVTPDDVVYGRIIQARSYLFSYLPSGPARTVHCGVMVFDFLGLSGRLIVFLSVGLSLVCMALGGFLWLSGRRLMNLRTRHFTISLTWFFALVILGIITNILGLFVLAIIVFAILVISFIAMFELLYLA